MKKFPVVLDLETKKIFREEPDTQKLGITVVAIYDYKDNTQRIFTEKELGQLFPILESASYIIGYNVRHFDVQVLQGYYPGSVENFPTFDIMDDVRDKIGRRLSLNELISTTLGLKKTGHGLQAIEFYKEGRWDELKKYCMDDTMLTKALFEYGIKNREVFYLNEVGKISIKVDWQKYLDGQESNDMPLTLPF
jgi:DEAD/DEAH box helicase domain-containing protein